MYKERLYHAAKQATSDARVVQVGTPKAESITHESIALGILGEQGVKKVHKRKERAREILTRLKKQGEKVNQRMSNVQKSAPNDRAKRRPDSLYKILSKYGIKKE